MDFGQAFRQIIKRIFDSSKEAIRTITVGDPWSFNDTSMTAWLQPKMFIDKSLLHGIWTFDVPTESWRIFENGAYLLHTKDSVNISAINSKLTISAGASLNDTSYVKSRRSPRYQPNRGHLYSTALGLPSPTALGERSFGVCTPENGVYFKLKLDGNLYACIDSGGVSIKEELITIPAGVNLELGNVFDIQFQWRGVGNYKFFINLKEVHAINFLGTLDNKLSFENPALPVCYKSTNLGDNVEFWVGCVDVTSEGGGDENLIYGSVTATDLSLGTGENAHMAVMVSETFNGKINTRDLIMDRITTSCNNESVVTVYATTDLSILDGTVWSNYRGRDNIKYASNGDLTVDLTSLNLVEVIKTRVEQDFKNDIVNPSKKNSFYLTAGDIIIITVQASATNDFYSTFEFTEEI